MLVSSPMCGRIDGKRRRVKTRCVIRNVRITSVDVQIKGGKNWEELERVSNVAAR